MPSFNPRPAFRITAAVVEEAARVHQLEAWQLLRRNRERQYSHVRFGIIWVLRQLGGSYNRIRDQLGFEDHKSVMYGHRQAALMRDTDPEYRQWTDDLLRYASTISPMVVAEAA